MNEREEKDAKKATKKNQMANEKQLSQKNLRSESITQLRQTARAERSPKFKKNFFQWLQYKIGLGLIFVYFRS